jgi:hypothetical protein
MSQYPVRQQHHARTFVVIAPGRRTPFVRCGEKDHYNPAVPGDMAELRTVLGYNHR